LSASITAGMPSFLLRCCLFDVVVLSRKSVLPILENVGELSVTLAPHIASRFHTNTLSNHRWTAGHQPHQILIPHVGQTPQAARTLRVLVGESVCDFVTPACQIQTQLRQPTPNGQPHTREGIPDPQAPQQYRKTPLGTTRQTLTQSLVQD
jgi:hypothetical protein